LVLVDLKVWSPPLEVSRMFVGYFMYQENGVERLGYVRK
jgi:hypothetical protein